MDILIYLHSLKANHNKDYSVVKTFKAAEVAFFYLRYKLKLRLQPTRLIKTSYQFKHVNELYYQKFELGRFN